MSSKTSTLSSSKLTKGCKQVLQLLEDSDLLSSAQDIHGRLRRIDPKAPGLTTVYRSLESLVQVGLVQAVDFGDKERRYEVVKPGEHHHHLLCDQCGTSVHLDQCLIEDFEATIRNKYDFDVHGHVLELFGTCPKCRKSKARS
jgi:Fur family transcriptional regulator, ferric uptake regulator